MTFREALVKTRKLLAYASIDEAHLESELILRHVTGSTRVDFFINPNHNLTQNQEDNLQQLVQRRQSGEPIAYILGTQQFYGLDFYVNSNTFIPRPETELLVEKSIQWAKERHRIAIADIGTGCGAIAISLAYHLPNVTIYATDISSYALTVAKINLEFHQQNGRICLLQGNLLKPLPEPVDLIIANLPYVKYTDLVRVNTYGHEPTLALNGGPEGTTLITELCYQASDRLNKGGRLLLEIEPRQASMVTKLLDYLFPSATTETYHDFNELSRIVSLTLTV